MTLYDVPMAYYILEALCLILKFYCSITHTIKLLVS